MKEKMKNQKGVALIATMFVMIILFGLTGVFVLRTNSDKKLSQIERESLKSFYGAQGGAELALKQLDVLINSYLQNTIYNASPSGVITYTKSKVNSGKGIEWLGYACRYQDQAVLTEDGDQAFYTQTGSLGDMNYSYTITISEKYEPSASGTDAWDFPYSFRIESVSTDNDISNKIILSGDFTVRVQRDNFAKYALFTNTQTTDSGSNVWFTDKTIFAGPLHTNGRYNFAYGGTFADNIQQQEQTARFYNNGWTVLIDGDNNGAIDVPVFNNGFDRGVDAVTISSPTLESDMVDQAASDATISGDGIYVPNNGSSLTGGIYVEGDCDINMTVNGDDNAVYSISQGGVQKNITVDRANNQTTIETVGTGVETYSGIPDGEDDAGSLIFVNGEITGLGGTVQRDTELTVASSEDVIIDNHILYSDFDAGSGTPGQSDYVPPSVSQDADETKNLLGIVSWNGDVRIGTSAPDDITVDGTVLASNGVFQVDNYSSGSPRGTATILGGVISNNYGAFGTFNGSTGQPVSGYGRNFIYDERMKEGSAPPYFPTLDTFLAFTNDIADKIVWQEGE